MTCSWWSTCLNMLELDMQNDEAFDQIIKQAHATWRNHGMNESNAVFSLIAVRRIRRLDDERCRDEKLSNSKMMYRVEVYYRPIDIMVNELEARIEGLEEISGAFGLMHPERLRNTSDDELRSSADK